MLFHTKKKQKIKLRKRDNKQKIKNIFKKIFILFTIFIVIFAAFFIKRYINIFLLDENNSVFKIQTIKVYVSEFDKFKFKFKFKFKKNFEKDEKLFLQNSNIKTGDNLFKLNVNESEKKIAKNFPNIKTVKIVKYYPKRIVFYIKLEEPLFFYKTSAEPKNKFLICENGKILSEKQSILEITDKLVELDKETLFKQSEDKYKKYKIDKQKICFLAEFINNLKTNQKKFFEQIEKISMSENFDLKIYLKNNIVVIFGKYDYTNKTFINSEEIKEKIVFFEKIMENLNNNKKIVENLEINLKNISLNKNFKISEESFAILKEN